MYGQFLVIVLGTLATASLALPLFVAGLLQTRHVPKLNIRRTDLEEVWKRRNPFD